MLWKVCYVNGKKVFTARAFLQKETLARLISILKDKTIYGNQYTNAVIDLFGDKTSSTLLNSYVDWIGMSLDSS